MLLHEQCETGRGWRLGWEMSAKCQGNAARLLRSWVRIPPGAWIFVCFECRVLSDRGLCDELITRPEESYRLCCVLVCDLETSRTGAPYIYIYIYDISSLRVKVVLVYCDSYNILTETEGNSYRNNQQDATVYQNLLFHVYMKLNMFRSTHRPSPEAQNCTSSLWFSIRAILLDVEVAGRCQRPATSKSNISRMQNQRLVVQF